MTESPAVLTGGHWETVRGVSRWVPDPPRPRVEGCYCGAPTAGRRIYCEPCRIESLRHSWRESKRRRKGAAA